MTTKKILMGGWFDLPRLGTEVWSALVRRQGVTYDKSMGFKFDSTTDVSGAVATLMASGIEVELVLRCFVCGKSACEGCPYYASCDRTRVSSLCLCSDHSSGASAFAEYAKTFDVHLSA